MQNQQIRFFSSELPYKMKVPSMGDSVTEGTVVLIKKKPGDSVKEDEVVLVIETDKVSVDVRSPKSGIVVAVNCKENETVLVGGDLIDIDLSGTSSSSSSPPSSSSSSPKPVNPQTTTPTKSAQPYAATSVPPAASSTLGRTPSIKFRHGKANTPTSPSHPAPTTKATTSATKSSPSSTAAAATSTSSTLPAPMGSVRIPPPAQQPYVEVPAKYRRKPLSKREIEMIEMGGASP